MMRTPAYCVVALTICGGVFAALPALAGPVEMPNRKPGLWEIRVSPGASMPAMTMQQCTDASTDKDMAASFSPMAKEMCSKQDMQKTATGIVIDSTCTIGGVSSVSHTEITGDFNSAYSMKVSTKSAGNQPESTTMMDAKWLGACKADQKAGDIVMPGGMKMNIKDMQAVKGARPKQ
jgi:hypothetical protein